SVDVDTGSQSHNVRLLTEDSVSVDGVTVTVVETDGQRTVSWLGRTYRLDRAKALSVDETSQRQRSSDSPGRLTAPMPGRIVKIGVEQGQHVSQNQPLVVLEAMKMEHVVEAPHAGVVSEICV